MGGPERLRRLQDPIDPPPDDAFVRAGHAHVALEGRAAGEDLLVGGGHVGVGAQHGRNPAVQVPAHQLHVAGGLGVEIQEDDLHVGGHFPEHAVGRLERGVDRGHEDAPQQAQNAHPDVVVRLEHGERKPRSVVGVVGRFDDPGLGLQNRVDFSAPVDVVAHRNAVDPGGDQLAVDGRREP